jgi:hypothetical protein
VHRWILKPKPSRRFVKFIAIQPTTPRRFSRFIAIRKKQPPHQHLGPTTLPRRRHLTQVPRHHHVSAQGPPHYHAGATSPMRHLTATQASRAHLTATQTPPHPRHEFLVKKQNLQPKTRTPDITLQPVTLLPLGYHCVCDYVSHLNAFELSTQKSKRIEVPHPSRLRLPFRRCCLPPAAPPRTAVAAVHTAAAYQNRRPAPSRCFPLSTPPPPSASRCCSCQCHP